MTLKEKISFLENKHFGEWFTTRCSVSRDISDTQNMWCICGKLATGLHESSCRKFAKKVNEETVRRLTHLCDGLSLEEALDKATS